MDVAPRLSNEAKARIARQREYDEAALRARYRDGVQGPLEKSASTLEKRDVFSNMQWPRVAGTVLEKYVIENLPIAKTPSSKPTAERSRQAIARKWIAGDSGPLEQAASEHENAFVYRPYLEPGEPRQLLAQIALKLPMNKLPNITEDLS